MVSEQTAYCEKCNKNIALKNPVKKETNTGKKFIEGQCEICGSVVYAINAQHGVD